MKVLNGMFAAALVASLSGPAFAKGAKTEAECTAKKGWEWDAAKSKCHKAKKNAPTTVTKKSSQGHEIINLFGPKGPANLKTRVFSI